MSDELQWLSAIELAERIARREVSATEVLDAHIAQVDAHNDRLNLVVHRNDDAARFEAARVDAALGAGEETGPLTGVPMTIKDSLQTVGMTTTSGAPELADFQPEVDAIPVARLKEAGANIWAKTNLPIYAGDVQSFNEIYGTSNNPWDETRSVGGSSGGSAGALAAGFTPLEVGSDIAGSIRNPAAMCGVVGHKPSYGIVSAKGQIPGPPGTLTQADLAVVGPMARTVADCRLALDVLSGADDWHDVAWTLTLPPARTREVSELRVAVWASDDYCPVDPEIETAVRRVASELEQAGARVDDAARPVGFDFAKADRTFQDLLGAALSGSWSLQQLDNIADRLANGEDVDGDLGVRGASGRHRYWLSNNERRLQMRARWREFFTDWDVVLAPISPTVAIPHDHRHPMTQRTIDVAGTVRPYTDQMKWMGLFGLTYLPVTTVPIAQHSSGLPIGVQVVAPFLEDRTALAVAEIVEQITGGTQRPPGL